MKTDASQAEEQLDTFIKKFEPRRQALIRSVRKALRRRFPTANELVPDPKKVLLGSGKQTRFIRLESAAGLNRPEIETLLSSAAARAKAPLPSNGRGKLVIRSVSAKQRPRRRAGR